MSRSGYSDEIDDQLQYGRWRGMVASAIRGKRGQKLLQDLADAMDAMPEKKLIANKLKTEENNYCALGVVGKARGIDLDAVDPEDHDMVASVFDIAAPLAQEIVYLNDEECDRLSPEERWTYIRKWVASELKKPPTSGERAE